MPGCTQRWQCKSGPYSEHATNNNRHAVPTFSGAAVSLLSLCVGFCCLQLLQGRCCCNHATQRILAHPQVLISAHAPHILVKCPDLGHAIYMIDCVYIHPQTRRTMPESNMHHPCHPLHSALSRANIMSTNVQTDMTSPASLASFPPAEPSHLEFTRLKDHDILAVYPLPHRQYALPAQPAQLHVLSLHERMAQASRGCSGAAPPCGLTKGGLEVGDMAPLSERWAARRCTMASWRLDRGLPCSRRSSSSWSVSRQ